jgi:transketolase N-terminal domain/subunit
VLAVDPLAVGWKHFRLEGVKYRGHDVTIVWEARAERKRYEDVRPGLTVIVDGREAAHAEKLERVEVPLVGQ